MSTTRTWTGAVNNDAANPGNWTPTGPVEPGDNLIVGFPASPGMPNPTLDISGDALRGDTIGSGSGTFILSHDAVLNLGVLPGHDTVNVHGKATVNTTEPGIPFSISVQINLDPHADLFGSANFGQFGNEVISGGKDSQWHVSADNILGASNLTVDTDVVGHGKFIVGTGQFPPLGSTLEFGGSVAKGISVDLSSAGVVNSPSRLLLDHPEEFRGSVTLHTASTLVDLIGEAQKAASWSFKNDLLSICDSKGHVIDKLHIEDTTPGMGGGLSVTHVNGDVIVAAGQDYHGVIA
jgi:hypothetical protein